MLKCPCCGTNEDLIKLGNGNMSVCARCDLISFEMIKIEITRINSSIVPQEIKDILIGKQPYVGICDWSDPESLDEITIPYGKVLEEIEERNIHGAGSLIDELRNSGQKSIILMKDEFQILKKVRLYDDSFISNLKS